MTEQQTHEHIRPPVAFKHAPRGLRTLADIYDHVVEHHDGDITKCPDVVKMDLRIMSQDLHAWADRIEGKHTLRHRVKERWSDSHLRRLVLVDHDLFMFAWGIGAATFFGDFAVGALAVAAAAWYRLIPPKSHDRNQQNQEQQVEVMSVPGLGALLGGLQGGRPQQKDDRPQPGQYL